MHKIFKIFGDKTTVKKNTYGKNKLYRLLKSDSIILGTYNTHKNTLLLQGGYNLYVPNENTADFITKLISLKDEDKLLFPNGDEIGMFIRYTFNKKYKPYFRCRLKSKFGMVTISNIDKEFNNIKIDVVMLNSENTYDLFDDFNTYEKDLKKLKMLF